MVNTCEPLINVVKIKRAKGADRLEPKGKQPRLALFMLKPHGYQCCRRIDGT